MTKIVQKFLAFAVIAVVMSSFTGVQVTNFSGTYTLNEGKSELGQFGGRGVATKIVVDQKGNDVSVTRTNNMNGQPMTVTENLVEGKESETTLFNNAKKKSTLKWAADGQSFSITYSILFEANGQNFEVKGVENWGLAPDGKVLTLQSTITTPQGEVTLKAAYDKQ